MTSFNKLWFSLLSDGHYRGLRRHVTTSVRGGNDELREGKMTFVEAVPSAAPFFFLAPEPIPTSRGASGTEAVAGRMIAPWAIHPRTMGHNDWDYERKPYQMVQKEDTSPERHWSEVRVSFRYLLVAEPLDKLGYVFHTGNITGASPLGFMARDVSSSSSNEAHTTYNINDPRKMEDNSFFFRGTFTNPNHAVTEKASSL
ncbi:hypothetical protein EDD17DRAFT_1516249 [Pisolithus thermaeus]|nr:hypothetical protein EDD17DRAFT_1516249 [Pisolithus thermaeus]